MKKLLALVLAATLTSTAAAKVWVSVYQHDGKTPLPAVDADHPNVYRDIMVGTRLTLVVRSDGNAPFLGSLWLSWEDANYARLSGRRLIPPLPPSKVPTYEDSSLNAAGTYAFVRDSQDNSGIGLVLSNDTSPHVNGGHAAYPGDWFVVDYYAEQVGVCEVGLYPVGSKVPLQVLFFTHVPGRDFNRDTVVNGADFARLASCWRSTAAPDSNQTAPLDLTADSRVDLADLAAFSGWWLERIDSPLAPVPAKVLEERWESAPAGVYLPGSTITGAAGSWRVGDTVSQYSSAGASPHRVEVLADNGNRLLHLRSVESFSGYEDNVHVSLQDIQGTNLDFAIPLTADTVISFKEVGELTHPQLRSSGRDCRFPPCFDNISLVLRDNRGNALRYVLQRFPGAVANGPNSALVDHYREVFLDPDAGSYQRHLFRDFETIAGFSGENAEIVYIAFAIDQHGWAILDDLVIGPQP